ncbi:MAG: rhomboid family intramembrane serine protease [Flavisolibacter sp.]
MSNFRYYRPSNFPPITKNLIIINVLVWITQLIFDKQYDITDKLALYPIGTPMFKPYQIATHMFAHASYDGAGNIIFYHILFNMFALWMFGRILENVWGGKRFLLFYLICGVGAALVHLTVQYFTGSYSAAIGASGAIMGIFAAFAYLFPNTELFILFIPIPIKAKWAVLGLAAYDLFGGYSGSDNVAHFAHLGGALTGFILVLIWNKTNRKKFY